MIKGIIDPTNFDIEFRKISRNKRGIARSRIDFENIDVEAKIRLVMFLISKASHLDSVVYKILFWERDEKIEEYLLKNMKGQYTKAKPYKNGARAGIIFIKEKTLEPNFLRSILLRHFNFELAKEPSLNIRVQLAVNNKEKFSILFDIYDDRGCYVYYF